MDAQRGAALGLTRLAHLFCEMMMRLELTGRARDRSCALPLTREDLAEVTGLSPAHLNRTLQRLRRLELMSFVRGQLTIHDWNGLVTLAEFRTDYLHIPGGRAA